MYNINSALNAKTACHSEDVSHWDSVFLHYEETSMTARLTADSAVYAALRSPNSTKFPPAKLDSFCIGCSHYRLVAHNLLRYVCMHSVNPLPTCNDRCCQFSSDTEPGILSRPLK